MWNAGRFPLAAVCCVALAVGASARAVSARPSVRKPAEPQPQIDTTRGSGSAISASDLLQRGQASYRAGDYKSAIEALKAAADGFMSPAEMQHYIETGHYRSLADFETALVYLALAWDKLGKQQEARGQVVRLATAEGVEPIYASLRLDPEVAGFEELAVRLVPSMPLPSNGVLARARGTAVAGAVTAGATSPRAPSPGAAPADGPGPPAAIAAAAAPAEKEPAPKMAREPEASKEAVAEKVRANRTAADRKAAAAIAAGSAQAVKADGDRVAALPTGVRRSLYLAIQRAEAFAAAGQFDEANDLYLRVLSYPECSREVVALVGTGLYRTGDFAKAAVALGRLGTFARGEEDLRYYYAVSLYEIGQYEKAQTELRCALPYVEITDAVSRYRVKIELTVASRLALR